MTTKIVTGPGKYRLRNGEIETLRDVSREGCKEELLGQTYDWFYKADGFVFEEDSKHQHDIMEKIEDKWDDYVKSNKE